MTRSSPRTMISSLAVAVGILLVGCAGTPADAESTDGGPATVEPIDGSELSTITLTEEAASRLGLTTVEVAADTGAASGGRTMIPYGAVIYDNEGATWTYTSIGDLVFVREAITVDRIEGDRALLTSGPDVGTEVVTLGAAELYGAELGLGQ